MPAAAESAFDCAATAFLHPADHAGLALREIGAAAAGGRRDEARGKIVGGTLDGGSDRGLLQRGDDPEQSRRLGAEGVAARADRAAARDQLSHLGEVLFALLVQRLHLLARPVDRPRERGELRSTSGVRSCTTVPEPEVPVSVPVFSPSASWLKRADAIWMSGRRPCAESA